MSIGGCLSSVIGLLIGVAAAILAPLFLILGVDQSMVPPELRDMLPPEIFDGGMMPPDYYEDYESAVPDYQDSADTLHYVGTPQDQALFLLQAINDQRYNEVESVLCPSDYATLREQSGAWMYENANCEADGDLVNCTADIYRDGTLLGSQIAFSFSYDGVYLCTAN